MFIELERADMYHPEKIENSVYMVNLNKHVLDNNYGYEVEDGKIARYVSGEED